MALYRLYVGSAAHVVTNPAGWNPAPLAGDPYVTFSDSDKAVAVAPATSILTSFTPGTDRNDFTGEVGVRLGIGASNIPVNRIGARRHHVNQTGLHTVKVYEWFGDTVMATAVVDYTGVAVGDYAWANVPAITLLAGGYYAVMMAVTAFDGQTWCNPGIATFTGMVNVYDCYRVPASALATGTSNDMFIGLDLGSGPMGSYGVASTTVYDGNRHYAEVTFSGSAVGLYNDLTGDGAMLQSDGKVRIGPTVYDAFPPLANGDVVGIASDITAGRVWFRVNGGLWNNSPMQAPDETVVL